jgi:hypothetical protein
LVFFSGEAGGATDLRRLRRRAAPFISQKKNEFCGLRKPHPQEATLLRFAEATLLRFAETALLQIGGQRCGDRPSVTGGSRTS